MLLHGELLQKYLQEKMAVDSQVHNAESPIATLISQWNLNCFVFNMNPLGNDMDFVYMNENKEENRSVGSELAPKHVARKPIFVKSWSEGEGQDLVLAKAPTWPP